MNSEQLEKIREGDGFIAALDQSGGSRAAMSKVTSWISMSLDAEGALPHGKRPTNQLAGVGRRLEQDGGHHQRRRQR